jgi:hypothetical protein
MKKNKIPTIIGLIVLVFGLAAGIFLVQNSTIFRLGASGENEPKDVRITNINDTSFTVSWVTSKETSGFIKYGEEETLSKTELDELGEKGFTHYLTVNGLKPDTKYSFKINSGGADFDNNGTSWQVNTGPTIPTNAGQLTVSGTILEQTGQPAKKALVYLTIAGSSPLSSTTSQNGSWVIPLNFARTQELSAFILIQESSSLLEISVNAGPNGIASAQIYPQSAKPVPAITLGTTNDFKSNPPSSSDGIPKADLSVPDAKEKESGFNVKETSSVENTTVTLESIVNGEKVSTDLPEFFGEGPAGTTLSITVESEAQSAEVKVPGSGDWKWTPPNNLEPGSHTVTITWRDAAGVLRKLTRTFIVEASENPSFTATPSATLTTTPTATTTPTVTPTTTISTTPTATKTPTITPTTTVAPTTPETGSLTPTIILFMMGIAIILFATIAWKKSEINA